MQYDTAPCSHALSMVDHIGSANVNSMIDAARNTEINGLAQRLNAVKLKLMMKGGRHVLIWDFMNIIMTKSHPFLFPDTKRYYASVNAPSILRTTDRSYSVIVSLSVTDYA